MPGAPWAPGIRPTPSSETTSPRHKQRHRRTSDRVQSTATTRPVRTVGPGQKRDPESRHYNGDNETGAQRRTQDDRRAGVSIAVNEDIINSIPPRFAKLLQRKDDEDLACGIITLTPAEAQCIIDEMAFPRHRRLSAPHYNMLADTMLNDEFMLAPDISFRPHGAGRRPTPTTRRRHRRRDPEVDRPRRMDTERRGNTREP